MAEPKTTKFVALQREGQTYIILYHPGQEHLAIEQVDAWSEDPDLNLVHEAAQSMIDSVREQAE